MPGLSIFGAEVALGDDSQVYWRRSAPGYEFAGDLAISRPGVNPPIAPEIIDGAGPTYVSIIRLRDDAGRVLINLSGQPEHDTTNPDEFTAAAESNIRLCVQYKERRVVIAIGDTTDPYHFLPANAADVLAFVTDWKADADRTMEPVHAALVWGGGDSLVDFRDFTVPRRVKLAPGAIDGGFAASARLRYRIAPAAGIDAGPIVASARLRNHIPIAARLEAGPVTGGVQLRYRILPAARVDAGPLTGRVILRDPRSFKLAIRATAPSHVVLTALEIRHPAIAEPVRVVNDTQDHTIGGERYVGLRFGARLAGDIEGQAPRAELVIDNVGRELTQWIEAADGGVGATVHVMQVLDGTPEWEMTMDVAHVRLDQERVTARLGFDPLLGRAAVTLRHDPQISPGLF